MLRQLATTLRLHFRNPLALLYSYLFPTIFLIAFLLLYRHDEVPLVRHMGELLTVTILGGACFGLPTTLVSERERGVWRRYRLAPISTGALIASTVAARYILVLFAGLVQLALAMALGMPAPRHPVDLWLAFTCVAVALLGLGLVLAMLANTVPAVQALGQCVFLPMLIIGGVAVPVASLPEWAQHLAAFFPGRYAVDALQACVTGGGLAAAQFNAFALLVIGAAGCLAAASLFRWDAQQRIGTAAGIRGLAIAVAAWLAVGLVAEARGRTVTARPSPPAVSSSPSPSPTPAPPPATQPTPIEAAPQVPPPTVSLTPAETRVTKTDKAPAPRPETKPSAVPPPPATNTSSRNPESPSSSSLPTAAGWRGVTMEHVERDLRFDRLPADAGIVAPIAPEDEQPDTDMANQLDFMASALLQWKPAQVQDPVQRVRNVLYVAAVPDVFQMDPLERFVPWVVFEHLRQTVPKDDLVKILYWIALHPTEGDDSAVDQLRELRLGNGPSDIQQTRERAALYAVKLLGRITGKIAKR